MNTRTSGDTFGSGWPADRGRESEVCRFGGVAGAARVRLRPRVVGVPVHTIFALVSGLLVLIWWVTASAQIQQEWVVRYRGPDGSDSVARAMVLDAATNIIV